MLNVLATLEGFSTKFESGVNLVDAEIVLGSGQGGTTCRLVVSDPLHTIAKALIEHTLSNGGISAGVKEEKPATSNTPSNPSGVTKSPQGKGIVSSGGGFTPQVKAFADMVASKEHPYPLDGKGYYTHNFERHGLFTDADIVAGDGFPKIPTGQGYGGNVGRYQFNRGDWSEAKKDSRMKGQITGYTDKDQDLIFYYKLMYRNRGGKELLAGDLDGAIIKAGKEWASIPGSPYKQVQADYTKEQAVAYYKQRLVYWQSVDGAGVTTQDPKVEPPTQATGNTDTTTGNATVKGGVLTISIYDRSFEFVHVGTKAGADGLTTISGQGVRWIMSRRKQNRTTKNTTLKAIAQKIATDHKLTLEWQSSIDPEYTHLDQTGLSDYQLLYRECDQVGLMVSESEGKLIIKSRDRLNNAVLDVARGLNLVDYGFEDKALSSNSTEAGSLLVQDNKTSIDPLTGKPLTKTDATRSKQVGISGQPTAKVGGTKKVEPPNERARTKRVAGLPSSFTLLLSQTTIGLKPLDTITSSGFGDTLDRIWVIDRVAHKILSNLTELSVVSPVDVIDNVPTPLAQSATNTSNPTAAKTPPTSYWIYPCNGIVTDKYGYRSWRKRNHNGYDIGNVSGTPVYAVQSGVVTYVGDKNNGGGNQLQILHDNGYETYYLHNRAILVKVGQRVEQGQQVTEMGNTGVGTGVHLHLEIRLNKEPIDPAKFWPKLYIGSTITAKEQTAS